MNVIDSAQSVLILNLKTKEMKKKIPFLILSLHLKTVRTMRA